MLALAGTHPDHSHTYLTYVHRLSAVMAHDMAGNASCTGETLTFSPSTNPTLTDDSTNASIMGKNTERPDGKTHCLRRRHGEHASGPMCQAGSCTQDESTTPFVSEEAVVIVIVR